MELKKLLILTAAVLMVGSAVACGNPGSSSEPSSEPAPTSEELVKDAADYLWQLYKARDGKELTGSFDVVNKVSIGREIVSVAWTIDVEGAKDAYKIEKKDDNYSTIYVGYNDYLVTEDSTGKISASFTHGDVTKTLAEVYASDETRHAIEFSTPKKLLEGYAVTIKADEYGLVKDPTPSITKEFTAKSFAKEEVTVKVDLKNLYYNYSAVYFGKSVENDTYTITAPAGYVVSKIELESYGK